jgi:hypothetical protein
MKTILLYVGAAIVILWGTAHIVIPTRSIVEGFEPTSADNRRIVLMEWLMEGVLLIFLGVLVTLFASLAPQSGTPAQLVYRACASVLVVMACISVFTGARTAILPMKLCPLIFLTAAALFFLPTVI